MDNSLNEANETVHKVESEWHYPILTKHGFVAITKEQVGFVRRYEYNHPTMKNIITANTGVNADYWDDSEGGYGYCRSLEKHLETICI